MFNLGNPVLATPAGGSHSAAALGPFVGTPLQIALGSFLEGLGLPIPSELLLVATPLTGLGAGPALALATGGYLLGAAGAYWGGVRGGARVLEQIGKLAGWGQAEADRLSALFRRWGPLMGFMSHFLPPIRSASLWAAGALRVDPRRYFPALAFSTILYNGLWLTAGLSLAPYLGLITRWAGPLALGLFLTLALFRWVRTRQRRGDLW